MSKDKKDKKKKDDKDKKKETRTIRTSYMGPRTKKPPKGEDDE